jgi:hypothetical protein
MAHPYVILEPGSSTTVDITSYFRGFTQSPIYSISAESTLFTASLSGSTITVTANELGGIGTILMQVTDSEGTTFDQRLGVAVTGETLGIHPEWNENDIEVAKREFFTLDGQRVSQMRSQEVYLMKITEVSGKTHTMKVMKE